MKTPKADTLIWPPLPDHVDSGRGPVKVVRAKLKEGLAGQYDPFKRTITIHADAVGSVAWCTLFHEEAHAWIDDTGEAFSLKVEEQVCRAVAAARTAAMASTLRRR